MQPAHSIIGAILNLQFKQLIGLNKFDFRRDFNEIRRRRANAWPRPARKITSPFNFNDSRYPGKSASTLPAARRRWAAGRMELVDRRAALGALAAGPSVQ